MSYNMELFHDDFEDQLLQKQACFERGISDATTTPGADLPELEDLEDFEPQRTVAMRPSCKGLHSVAGMEDIRVKFLADPGPDVKRNYPRVPCRTWAITPDDPEAMNPPCKEDLDQRSVDFHPMVTMHLFRP
ncbi:unnamed protein product [Durusdinium trenchii]|uniref:Uncharacterized protein n=1 Tax=Durusdinium trenchii TaxID=1381693 RepID=A0ABP0KP09_9DINO